MAKGREIFPAMIKKQREIYPRKLYSNSECDVCETHTEEVRLFGDKILCKKCFRSRNENTNNR